MSRSTLLLLICALFCACKAKEGAACKRTLDCVDGLKCVKWDDDHEDVIGDCSANKCCATKADDRKARKRKVYAACDALIGAVDDSRNALRISRKTPPELKKLAQALDGVVEDYKDVRLADQALDDFRDDYVGLAKALAASARKKAQAINRFDGRVAIAETKAMSKIDGRESALVNRINDHCEGSKSAPMGEVFLQKDDAGRLIGQ